MLSPSFCWLFSSSHLLFDAAVDQRHAVFPNVVTQSDVLACRIPADVLETELDLRKTPLFFECFPYVCPEPVLVK
jgi:hypothetical protein